MTTQPRERDEQRARKAHRRVATPLHRKSTPRASSANVPPRPGKRPVRSPGWHTSSASGRSRSARPTSTRVDPGVTSSEAARIRDRVREPGAPPSERDPHVEPRLSSRPQRPPATSLARPRGTPGAAPSPSAARSGDPHTDFEARSRQPSARGRGRSPDPHPGRPPVGELLRYGIHTLMSLPRREPPRRRAGPGRPAHGNDRDWGRRASPRGDDDEETPWCRRRPRPRSPGLSVGTSERPQSLGPDLVRTTEGMADVCVCRRHEPHDRRLAGRLADDGPDGPLSPRGGPAPPGCVPRRSRGPLRCWEPVLKRSPGQAPGRDRGGSLRWAGRRQRRHRTPQSVNAFYTAEFVFGPGRGAWRDVSHREAVTMSSFTWWNETRIHGSLGDRSPPVRAGRRCTRPHH